MLLATLVSLAGKTSNLPRPRSKITAAVHGPMPLMRRRTAVASKVEHHIENNLMLDVSPGLQSKSPPTMRIGPLVDIRAEMDDRRRPATHRGQECATT